MNSLRRSTACALILASVFSPTSARASELHGRIGQIADDSAAPAENDGTTAGREELRRLFKEATARYSASDYRGAIDGFVRALTLLESEGGDAVVRGAILFNLGQAYEKAFETERQVRYLRLAHDTYTRYIREAEQGYSYDDVPTVQENLKQVDAKLEQVDTGAPTPEPEQEPNASLAPAQPAHSQGVVRQDVEAQPAYLKARRMRTTGIVVTSVGAGVTGLGLIMAWYTANFAELNKDLLLEDREAYNEQGRAAQATGIVTLAIGLGSLGAGIPMWIVGNKRMKAARASAVARLPFGVGIRADHQQVHLRISGRF
jgi:tetratricopeptide (TPR) repeat protein